MSGVLGLIATGLGVVKSLWARLGAKGLEDHKGKVAVRSKINLVTFEHRRAARQKIRVALGAIEEAIRQAYLARASDREIHPNDYENAAYSASHVLSQEGYAVRLLRDFDTMVQDIAGDLGEGSDAVVEACKVASNKLTSYLAHSFDLFIMAEETEDDRLAGRALRAILAAEDKLDAEMLQT
ncbi:MAG: hypothetical protein BGO12_04520 [Verrucomicrobia bacterium 61-8]|nr:hypothetical protein [Verrucomicrobiota bacterium]OJV06733.1 MAG: hypothetical protein BGO12_04520 [Verrucomicrobia bacterium 61-8]